jgi:hypothetical protein
VGCGCHSDKSVPFGVAGLGKRRRLAGTSNRSPSTTYVHSVSTGHNPAPLGCINSPSLSSPTQTQRIVWLWCLRGAGLRQIYTEIPYVVEGDLLAVPANGRQLTLNVESQPPPTPLTTTLFRSCQSQLAEVQQKRTRFNIFAGKHPLSAWML